MVSEPSLKRRWIVDMIHVDEELRISGAFKDGEHVIVEPLALLLLYPDSYQDGKMIQLAQHLFALHSCLVKIAREIIRCSISTLSHCKAYNLKYST